MRSFVHPKLESHRALHPTLGMSPPGSDYGYFIVPASGLKFGVKNLNVISSGSGSDWEHVSVSCVDRCPTWDEMCKIKDLFWAENETVLQFHPMKSAYVNAHEFCLHLWKQCGKNHPLPPKHLIA